MESNIKKHHKAGTASTRSKDGDKPCKISSLAAEPETPLQSAQRYKNTGNVYFKMRKYNEAIAQYNEAINICPKKNVNDLAIFYQNRAAAYEQLKKYSVVKADCTEALVLNPRYTKALLRRARILEQIGDLEAALKDTTVACIHEGSSNPPSLLKAHKIMEKLVKQQIRENLANKKLLMPSKHIIEKPFIKSFSNDPVFSRLQHPENIPEFFKKPLQALKDTKYDNIIPLCTEIIESPEFDTLPSIKLEVLLLRATFCVLLGDYVAAFQDFESLIISENASNNVRINALIKRAKLYMLLEIPEMAFKDFELAISINSCHGDIYYHRGCAYVFMDRLDKAKWDFEKAVECNPNFIMAYFQKCKIDYGFAILSKNVKLVKVIERNVEIALEKSSDPTDYIYLCIMYSEMISVLDSQHGKADTYITKAIEKYPENADLYLWKGLLQLRLNDNIDKAREYINKAIELDEKCEDAYLQLGIIEVVQRGNIEEAIRLLDKALIFYRTYRVLSMTYILRNTAKVQLDIKKELGSIPLFLKFPHVFKVQNEGIPDWSPKMHECIYRCIVYADAPLRRAQKYNDIGNIYFQMGKDNKAIAQYDKAVNICPKENVKDLAIFYQNRAAAYEQLKKYNAVKADCTKALKLNPRYTKALLRRAHVLEQIGDLDAALKDIIIACNHDDFSRPIYLSKAKEILEKLVRQHAEENWANKKFVMPSKHFIEKHIKCFSNDPVFSRLQCPESIPEFFKKPLQALKNAKYDDIIPLCTEIIKSPEFDTLPSTKVEVLLLRATFYVLSCDHVAAIQDFESLMTSKDASENVRINTLIKRASLYMEFEIFEMVFKDFELAININPNNSDIYYHRGQTYAFMDRLDEAKRDITKAIECNPNFIMAYLEKYHLDCKIAKLNGNMKLVEIAVRNFHKAFKKFLNSESVNYCYCLMYVNIFEIPQYLKVDTFLAKIIEKNSEDASLSVVYFVRGILQLNCNNIDKAAQYFNKAIEFDESFDLPYKALSGIEIQRGNIEEAIRLLDKALIYCRTFKDLLNIYNLKDTIKIQLYIKNELLSGMRNELFSGSSDDSVDSMIFKLHLNM